MGRLYKTVKRWALIGGLAGLLGTAAYGSIDKAYENLLSEDKDQFAATIKHMEGIKKKLPKSEQESYTKGIAELKVRLDESRKRLEDYKNLPETQKKLTAVKDLERYGGILESIGKTKAYQPGSIDDVYKLGKGFGYGLIIGAAFGTVKGGVRGTRDWRRGRKDEKIRRDLEKQKGNQNKGRR